MWCASRSEVCSLSRWSPEACPAQVVCWAGLCPVLQEDEAGNPKDPDGPAIDPKHDPLVLAAVGGHLDIVKQLEELHMLCSPCAAKEAAKTNQTAVIQHLAQGTAKLVLQVRRWEGAGRPWPSVQRAAHETRLSEWGGQSVVEAMHPGWPQAGPWHCLLCRPVSQEWSPDWVPVVYGVDPALPPLLAEQ